MIFNHARFQIWSAVQHPFQHDLSQMIYNNSQMPGVTSVVEALDYMAAVLYPQAKPAVANVAALPAVGNTINDLRIVLDDGDGKAASYRWFRIDGEATASWKKVGDLDFGADSIIQQWNLNTLERYVMKWGMDDLDSTGVAITGTTAGQRIYGGASANTHLSLYANNGDGASANTGYVQFGDNTRPLSNNTFSLGTTSERWLKGWFTEGQFGTLNLQAASITDSSGSISFGSTALTTSGTIAVGNFTINGTANTITNSSSSIGFGSSALTTTGDATFNKVTATGAASSFKTGTQIADLTFANGSITSSSATISLSANNLSTSGNGTFGRLDVDNIRLDGSAITNTATNADTTISANGTGKVEFLSDAQVTSKNLTVSGGNLSVTNGSATISGTGSLLDVDNIRLDGNTLSSTNANGDINLTPNGTGLVAFGKGAYPTTTNSFDLGKSSFNWNDLWINGSIKNGSNAITMSDLLSLRSTVYRDAGRTTPAQAGDALFYNGSQWLASVPDTEITHSTISGLTTGDSGHTQFVMLAGRSGGQTVQGDTAASGNLTLESTANATKGLIYFKDRIAPFTDASYSGGWSGEDIGDSSHNIRAVYSKGEFFGFRLENLASSPSSSGQNIGRMYYNTTDTDAYVDTGSTFKRLSINRFQSDTVWNGTDVSKVVTVSGLDARNAIWQLSDNANDYETMPGASIRKTSATSVTITFGTGNPPPAGSYRLIGVE